MVKTLKKSKQPSMETKICSGSGKASRASPISRKLILQVKQTVTTLKKKYMYVKGLAS